MPTGRRHRAAHGATVARVVVALTVAAIAAAWGRTASATSLDRVTRAALGMYIHGITPEIAEREIGAGGVPILLALLADPTFPRRDNVVAFLTYLAGDEATPALLAFLQRPPLTPAVPEEDRALLLAPQALGHMASRGHPLALDALLSMTDPQSGGGVLAEAASTAADPSAMRDDLLEMAVRGLAFASTPAARARLNDIADGAVIPAPDGRSLRRPARELLDEPAGAAPVDGPAAATTTDAPSAGGTVSPALDTHSVIHDHAITYANHVAVTSPMTDAGLDQVLSDGSLRVERADFSEDTACCATASRAGTARLFGTGGDGLDVIDNVTEQDTVLNNGTARAKVVRAINYCGGNGTNIIGCAWIGGNGMALVRVTNGTSSEAALWVHEYGHNIGLNHNGDSRYIMYAILYTTNNGVSQTECDAFHSPAPGADADVLQTGTCTAGCGAINPGETCDDGNACTDDACGSDNRCQHMFAPQCLTPIFSLLLDGECGDGVTESGEQCDDGNALDGDCCASDCSFEPAGALCGMFCGAALHCNGSGGCH